MMRIVAGKARGFRLQTLPGEDTTRPTTERVKESVFSMLQFEIEGRTVLDLFAGSGQMGLEAVSRGAAFAVFVDNSKDALEVVRSNARGAKLSDQVRIVNTNAQSFCRQTADRFDMVFLDPPYRAGLLPSLLLDVLPLMRVGGTVVCETDGTTALPEQVAGEETALSLEKQRRYGKTQIWIYRCVSQTEKDAIE